MISCRVETSLHSFASTDGLKLDLRGGRGGICGNRTMRSCGTQIEDMPGLEGEEGEEGVSWSRWSAPRHLTAFGKHETRDSRTES